MAPNSGFQGGPFAQISLLAPHLPFPAEQLQEAFLASVSLFLLSLLKSLVKCWKAPRQPAPKGVVHPVGTGSGPQSHRCVVSWGLRQKLPPP